MKHRHYAIVLTILAFAFLLRVLGQLLVLLGIAPFLPPMEEWYSGWIPYSVLLPVQILILAVQGWISKDVWTRSGFFAVHRPRLGRSLIYFSLLYFAVMVARYVVTMTLYPERRWFSGAIPIVFHWVLAGYLFVLGRYYGDEAACAARVSSHKAERSPLRSRGS